MMLFAFAGTAGAIPVTGSVTDEQDAPPELLPSGAVRDNPDLRRLTVSYDATSGAIEVALELWRALAYDRNDQYGEVTFAVGSRHDAAGDCVADTTGDAFVSLYFYRSVSRPQDSYFGSGARFEDYGGNSVQGRAATSDWTTFGATVGADPSKNRAYTCVRDVRLQSNGADEARGFCLGGPCPAGPPPPAGGDRTPPTVRWLSPRDGQTISGIYSETPRGREGWHSCQVEARDNVGIDRTENLVDGAFHDSQVSPPYSCEWDTREVPDGRHTLTVVAYDRAGNSARSTIVVTVRNASAAPPAPGSPPPANPSTPTAPGSPPAGPSSPATPTAPSSGPSGVLGENASFGSRIVGARTVGAFARQGLRVRVACPARCRVSVRLTVAPKVARRLGTKTTLAKASRRLAAAGRTVIRLRPSRRVAQRLLGLAKLDATLRVQAKQRNGVELRLRRNVTLRR
jgi:hypothetical protein